MVKTMRCLVADLVSTQSPTGNKPVKGIGDVDYGTEDPSEMFAAIFGGEAFQDWSVMTHILDVHCMILLTSVPI